jgi:hypothetical protein
MPITATTPLQHNGKSYPYYTATLAISPLVKDYIGGSVALKLVPYREKTEEEGGGFEMVEEQAISHVFLDVFQNIEAGDLILGQAVQGIMTAIQTYITLKGI